MSNNLFPLNSISRGYLFSTCHFSVSHEKQSLIVDFLQLKVEDLY